MEAAVTERCPSCRCALLTVADVRTCPQCTGQWVPLDTLLDVDGRLAATTRDALDEVRDPPRRCARCDAPLQRLERDHVTLRGCAAHGVWFEPDELFHAAAYPTGATPAVLRALIAQTAQARGIAWFVIALGVIVGVVLDGLALFSTGRDRWAILAVGALVTPIVCLPGWLRLWQLGRVRRWLVDRPDELRAVDLAVVRMSYGPRVVARLRFVRGMAHRIGFSIERSVLLLAELEREPPHGDSLARRAALAQALRARAHAAASPHRAGTSSPALPIST